MTKSIAMLLVAATATFTAPKQAHAARLGEDSSMTLMLVGAGAGLVLAAVGGASSYSVADSLGWFDESHSATATREALVTELGSEDAQRLLTQIDNCEQISSQQAEALRAKGLSQPRRLRLTAVCVALKSASN